MFKAVFSTLRRKNSLSFLERNKKAFERRIGEWSTQPIRQIAEPKKVGILVCPWLTTAVPFFSLEMAFMLRSEGNEVTLFWDPTDILFSSPTQEEISLLDDLIRKARKFFKVIDIRKAKQLGKSLPKDLIRDLLNEGAVKHYKGEALAKNFIQKDNENAMREIESYSKRLFTVLESSSVDWILVPGGFFGPSCVYRTVADQLGMGFTTFDSDFKILILAHQGIAAQVGGVEAIYKRLNSLSKSDPERVFAVSQASEQLAARELGKDVFHYQMVPKAGTSEKPFDIIVPLNYRPDTAALGRTLLFNSVEEWVREVGEWAIQQKEWRVCFRQHPAERFAHVITTDDIGSLVRSMDPSGDYLGFVAASDPVNTYDLMARCKVVLPFTSTLGIEAVYTGKPVILGTKCYYRDFGFTINPSSRSEYFQRLFEACEGRLDPSPERMDSAAIAYYVTQTCNFLNVPLTPLNEDYMEWGQRKPDELWSVKECQLLKKVLLSRRQLADILHEEYFGSVYGQSRKALS